MKLKLNFNFKLTAPCLVLCGSLGWARDLPALEEAPDGGDAQRLVALLDYLREDYAPTVLNHRVINAAEYEEQLRFADDAKSIASRLLEPGQSKDSLVARLSELEWKVRDKADPTDVARLCSEARDEVVRRFSLATSPARPPSLPAAETLYVQACAVCHGARGESGTPRALELRPMPASFQEHSRMDGLSPYRVYNTLTFGVPGTAMPSFDLLTPVERWNLAFYVFRLRHEGVPAVGPVAMSLSDMAARSDREILQTLGSHPDPAGALSYVRREAAFLEPSTSAGIEHSRALLHQAMEALSARRTIEADRLVIDAYLQGFEPLEPRLRARDLDATMAVERGFQSFRVAIVRKDTAGARAQVKILDSLLLELGEGNRRPFLPFAAAFLIFVREGIEAALLVGALLAGLRKLGRSDAARQIHFGWMSALPAGVLTWWISEKLIALTAQRELVEAAVALIAAGVLFSVSFWMISRAESRHWVGYLKRGLEEGLSRRNLAMLSGLAFLAVYREAAETVLFTQALLLESAGPPAQIWAGAGAGLFAVGVAAFIMSRTVLRLPLGPFFTVSGILLCGLAISFAGSGIWGLVAAGYLAPHPFPFPEVRWMGIHPDLTAVLVQLTILIVVSAAGFSNSLRRLAKQGGTVDRKTR